jgi:hypothetical protein
MQSAIPHGRGVVSISTSGAIHIDPAAAGSAQQAGASRSPNTAAAVGSVINQITDAFQGLFSASTQPAAISQGPSMFSAAAPAPADTLAGLRSLLDSISQKLSALAGGQIPAAQTPAPAATPFAASTPAAPSAPKVNPDWPYPDLGPNPFMDNPTGSGPTGSFGFNSYYFPTEATAQTIANMLGGKVVQQNVMLTAPGSHFKQNQPNYMVELPNGNTINPGFIAQAISSKQARTTIDAVIYSEVNNCACSPADAPRFVPVNPPLTSSTPPSTPPQDWSSLDQMSSHASRSATPDADLSAVNQQMQSILKMLQLLSRLLAGQQSMQQNSQSRRQVSL